MAKKAATSTKSATAAQAKKSRKPAPVVGETNLIRRVTVRPVNKAINEFNSGASVSVYVKVKEGEKERTQVFKGIVTKLQGAGAARTFTVRKVSFGVGVERTFPFGSPAIEKVDVINRGEVRRAKLYYLRGLEGKAAKIDSTLVAAGENDIQE